MSRPITTRNRTSQGLRFRTISGFTFGLPGSWTTRQTGDPIPSTSLEKALRKTLLIEVIPSVRCIVARHMAHAITIGRWTLNQILAIPTPSGRRTFRTIAHESRSPIWVGCNFWIHQSRIRSGSTCWSIGN